MKFNFDKNELKENDTYVLNTKCTSVRYIRTRKRKEEIQVQLSCHVNIKIQIDSLNT